MRYTAHLEEGTRIDGIEKLFEGIIYGFIAQPWNFPGATYHHALKVAEETIRMANISAFIFRKATCDIEFKGYIISKGWSVIVWLRRLHNDPTHFEDPMSFNPERWDTRPKHGTYQPFGGGSRFCPGIALVRVSLALFLHHLSIGYK